MMLARFLHVVNWNKDLTWHTVKTTELEEKGQKTLAEVRLKTVKLNDLLKLKLSR